MTIPHVNKTFEIVSKKFDRYKLIVSPTRITIRLANNLTAMDNQNIIAFLMNVADQPEMQNCTQTFRGSVYTDDSDKLFVNMQTKELKKEPISYIYHEDNL